MMNFKIITLFVVLLLSSFVNAQEADTLLQILKEELKVEMNELSTKEYPPYYMDFRVSEIKGVSIMSLNGSIVDESKIFKRIFNPSIRIGDYSFDNTHELENAFGAYPPNYSQLVDPLLPLENDSQVIKFKIWENTNKLYQNTILEFRDKLESARNLKKNPVSDFSVESLAKYYEDPLPTQLFEIDSDYWKRKLIYLDSLFAESENYYWGSSSFTFSVGREIFVSSEGAEIVENQTFCNLSVSGLLKLKNDELLPFSESFNVLLPDDLPDDEQLEKIILKKVNLMNLVVIAPKAEPFAGPALLSPKAAGVFFHEIFGHRIEGHRLENMYNSKTFKEKVDQAVLPESLSVISDPTLKSYNGTKLIGHYKYDNQGVKAQRVVNVEKGILKDFLMSRKPIEGFSKSNGHGRADIMSKPVSRQSNLLVLSDNGLSEKNLRKKLRKECKKQGTSYGYYFKAVSGGYTNTMIFTPDYFNVLPIEVYRIYTDGREDELVRGVSLIGTPLLMFSEILAAGDTYSVFSGICGAESGLIPVSTVAPALLVKKIETQNQFTVKPEWPILPPPKKTTNFE